MGPITGAISRAQHVRSITFFAVLTLIVSTSVGIAGAGTNAAPEFTHSSPDAWINSPPLTLARLRGRAVLIEFWTFDCINCRRTLPWLKSLHQRYANGGLVVVSVHTPELEHERDVQKVKAAIKRLGIEYPVMLDNDFSYWSAMANRYWPAFYLVDRQGKIRATAIGELHTGQARGEDFERQVKQALADEVAR